MGLDQLPEELLRIIFKQLDLKSIQNLYDTGNQRLQDVISLQGTIKECSLSKTTMASVHTIKLDFFKSISKNLQILDLSAIQDLSKTTLLPAIKKMVKLVTLNISYTQITIFDLVDIYEFCPTLKNITTNLQFHKSSTIYHQEKFTKCQDVFANFDNVHFVGSIDKLLSNLPLQILQKAKLDSLTYTIVHRDNDQMTHYNLESKPLHCNKICINMLYYYWKYFPNKNIHLLTPIIKDLPFEFEYIQIHECTIVISPVFEGYIKENFRYNRVSVVPNINSFSSVISNLIQSKSNHYVMIWNKETTNFDESFFHALDFQIKQLVPCIMTYAELMQPVALKSNWVCVNHPLLPDDSKTVENNGFKRKRVASPNIKIDYDDLLEDKKKVELTIFFRDFNMHRAVTLSSTSTFLRKLTFLQLRGPVRYSNEFFNILFRCCEKLITLDVEGSALSPCAPPISRSIPLSHSIRNLRICDKSIDMNTLFSSLCQCPRLENIMIVDKTIVLNDIPAADTLFKQCSNLYYLCIHLNSMCDTAVIKKLAMLNKAKRRYNRYHLCIEVIGNANLGYYYDPFLNVFRLQLQELCL